MVELQEWTRRAIWTRKVLYPTYRWPGIALAASPILVAGGLAVHDGVFAAFPATVAFLTGWLIQLAGVMAGIHKNLLDEPEDGEHPALVEAVKSGALQLSTLKRAIYACFLMVGLACVCLFFFSGIGIVMFGLAGLVASWVYSSGPLPLGKAGFADLLFFFFFGVVAVLGTYYVQAAPALSSSPMFEIVRRALPWHVLAVSLPIGALATSILIIDDIRDRKFDALKGKRTITVRFGIFWSRVELITLVAASYLSLFWFLVSWGFSVQVLLPLATIPLAFHVAQEVLTRDSYTDLLPMKRRMAWLLLSFSLLLAIGVATS